MEPHDASYSELVEVPTVTVEYPAPKLTAFGRWLLRMVLKLGIVHDLPQFHAAAQGRDTYEVTYEGRVLSYLEWLEFGPEFLRLAAESKRAQAGELDDQEAIDHVHRGSELYARYLNRIGIPAREVFKLPREEFEEKMHSFFAYQAAASPMPTPPTKRPTSTASTPPAGSSGNGSTASAEAKTERIESYR